MGKTSKLIDKIYDASNIDVRAVAKKYKKPALIGAGTIGAGALLIPVEEKNKIKQSLLRDRDKYPGYDSLGTMAARTIIPDNVGTTLGMVAGAGLAYKKGLGSKALRKQLNKTDSLVITPILKKMTDKHGDMPPRIIASALAGGAVGGWAAGTPFDIMQAKKDYDAGLKHYGNKMQAGLTATNPWTYNLGLYGADKLPK